MKRILVAIWGRIKLSRNICLQRPLFKTSWPEHSGNHFSGVLLSTQYTHFIIGLTRNLCVEKNILKKLYKSLRKTQQHIRPYYLTNHSCLCSPIILFSERWLSWIIKPTLKNRDEGFLSLAQGCRVSMVMKPALDTRLTKVILSFPLYFLIPHTRESTEWEGRARGQLYSWELHRKLPRGWGLLSVCQGCLVLFYTYGSLL